MTAETRRRSDKELDWTQISQRNADQLLPGDGVASCLLRKFLLMLCRHSSHKRVLVSHQDSTPVLFARRAQINLRSLRNLRRMRISLRLSNLRGLLSTKISCRPKMKMSAFTKIEIPLFWRRGSEKLQQSGEPVPFIERAACAPLRQSQAFNQTLVLRLAESLTLSSLR